MTNLEQLLRQAAHECADQGAASAPTSLDAHRLRRTGSAIEKALAFLTGASDAELVAQSDRSERNIAAFEALQRVTGQRGMVFLSNHDYVAQLREYCDRQGIVPPVLPEVGVYEQ
ncbi:MAG: hypothetical protein H0X24_00815 [Ktedonobacterales bacterium]|nr:hypothetical protein [Ktedonobacterales bacterium]